MNIQAMMKQAKEMQERLQKQMAEMRQEATAGGGMVTVTVNGMKQLQAIKIDPEVVSKDDLEMLQLLGTTASIAIDNSRLYAELAQRLRSLEAAQAEARRCQQAVLRAERLSVIGEKHCLLFPASPTSKKAVLTKAELPQKYSSSSAKRTE